MWLVSLHGPDRNRAMEDEFRAWQAKSPAHREAFEKTTDVWQAVPNTQAARDHMASIAQRPVREPVRARGTPWRWAAAAACLSALVVGGAVITQQWREQGVYATVVGEQRSVLLDDGTRMLLNTDTRLRVDYGAKQRTVEVAGGEALFEVAKDAARPFVVRVAGSEVVAVGTAFSVRFIDSPKHDDALTVTLIEGRVNVRPTVGGGDSLAPKEAVVLKPGDRLTLDHNARARAPVVESKVDRPNIERAMAWKRNEIAFQDTPLAGAIDEINRYSRTQVELSPEVQQANLDVSGVFRTGDSASFANAVALLHGLKVRENNGRLELEKFR
ncbi:FecR domain-containing protein [Roseateles saccharophilus]|uniref:FecR family protein n=1 Tax=Roseateles saccharophilus TaxID=304 RepID=A0A4R3U7V7_ROSSA|nr:FecR family protein [Roseateles saccharophilus]